MAFLRFIAGKKKEPNELLKDLPKKKLDNEKEEQSGVNLIIMLLQLSLSDYMMLWYRSVVCKKLFLFARICFQMAESTFVMIAFEWMTSVHLKRNE